MVFDQSDTLLIWSQLLNDAGCVLFRYFKARILHGLNASDNSRSNEGIHLALFFARDNVLTVKILY
ncbi:hypothetical protein ACLB1Q_08905 [Escherichia coli]